MLFSTDNIIEACITTGIYLSSHRVNECIQLSCFYAEWIRIIYLKYIEQRLYLNLLIFHYTSVLWNSKLKAFCLQNKIWGHHTIMWLPLLLLLLSFCHGLHRASFILNLESAAGADHFPCRHAQWPRSGCFSTVCLGRFNWQTAGGKTTSE